MSESEPKKPPAPDGLAAGGTKIWIAIVGKYDLRADELRVLEDACHEADLVDKIQVELVGAPMYMTGSMGQKVANPLFGEVRQHRATFASLMRQLALPDDQGVSPRSTGARKAANARWGKPA